MGKVYMNHPDSNDGNLTIPYATLDCKFPVTAFDAVSLFKEVSYFYLQFTNILVNVSALM